MAIRQRLIEFITLVVGSCAAGFSIAIWQHLLTFGVRGYGFGDDAIFLACTEGGLLGATLGIPTGLIVYYVVLHSRVSLAQVLVITLGSLVVGCLGGIIFGLPFAFATPVLTICIARYVRMHPQS